MKPKVGDVAWFIEWCSELAFYDGEGSDVDMERCRRKRRIVGSKDEAQRVAKKVWPVAEKTFGHVDYWQAEFVPYEEDDQDLYPGAGYWDEDESTFERYEGDEPEGGLP